MSTIGWSCEEGVNQAKQENQKDEQAITYDYKPGTSDRRIETKSPIVGVKYGNCCAQTQEDNRSHRRNGRTDLHDPGCSEMHLKFGVISV